MAEQATDSNSAIRDISDFQGSQFDVMIGRPLFIQKQTFLNFNLVQIKVAC